MIVRSVQSSRIGSLDTVESDASPTETSRSPAIACVAARIKIRAAELGFALCGITTASPPAYHAAYRQWLSDGFEGEMAYMREQEPRRRDPGQVVPRAKSIVAVALNYYTQPCHPDVAAEAAGEIARYARFDDYHVAMWSRLNALQAYVVELVPNANCKAYCDTGPITERDVAMRAGIGWIGKHTNLISRKLGNWFFLGELVLDVDLPADEPEAPHCGTCTRCVPACPTGAIVAPYRLDARRCISYLTIELKGSIPVELRPLIGARIYGCDDCLAACPWNKFAVVSDDPAVHPRADLAMPDLLELLSLDDVGFRERFRNSPIKRTKRRGLLRNVCVALGNIGDERALPALTLAAQSDPEPLVREHAAWAIARIEERTGPPSPPPASPTPPGPPPASPTPP